MFILRFDLRVAAFAETTHSQLRARLVTPSQSLDASDSAACSSSARLEPRLATHAVPLEAMWRLPETLCLAFEVDRGAFADLTCREHGAVDPGVVVVELRHRAQHVGQRLATVG